MSLFDDLQTNDFRPLADRVRPQTLDEFIGQEDIIGTNSLLRKMIETDNLSSMILYGPPGVGKTTLAKVIANVTSSSFNQLSAVESGVKDIKQVRDIAKLNKLNNKKTILFIDEIHRFNKAQQDVLLPYVEKGDIILIGATTENPSFEVNSALLSRTKVFLLKALTNEDLKIILKNAIKKEYPKNSIDNLAMEMIINISNGDARSMLNTLENILKFMPTSKKKITPKIVEDTMSERTFLYDKDGEEHYNLISALHKSIRNSDVDAAIYYLARILEAGEDPLYVARRLIRIASEDIGMANSNALVQATSAFEATRYIGMPEANVILTQVVVYLALSPKSNSLELAYMKAKDIAIKTAKEKVPFHLRNAVTSFDKKIGIGKGYEYSHDYENSMTDMQCLPDIIKNERFYYPSVFGNEKNAKARLEQIDKIKKTVSKKKDSYVKFF